MGWKSWPYWVKGGIILVIVYILFFTLFKSPLFCGNSVKNIFCWMTAIFSISPGALVTFIFLQSATGNILISIILFVVNLIIYFLIGALIGWIVGKIKKK